MCFPLCGWVGRSLKGDAFPVSPSGFICVLKVTLLQLWKGQKLRTETLTSISAKKGKS